MRLGCNKLIVAIFVANIHHGELSMMSNDLTDRFGSVASSICALHCAICGFLPVAFSALGLGFLLGQKVEWMFAIMAISFGLVALFLGWRQHRSKQVAGFLIVGVVGIMVSRGLEMGSDHHDHGTDAHHEEVGHAETATHGADHEGEEHHEDHAASEGEHHSDGHADHEGEGEDLSHMAGAIIGVLAGLTLLLGHIFNIRAARRSREESIA